MVSSVRGAVGNYESVKNSNIVISSINFDVLKIQKMVIVKSEFIQTPHTGQT